MIVTVYPEESTPFVRVIVKSPVPSATQVAATLTVQSFNPRKAKPGVLVITITPLAGIGFVNPRVNV